MPCLHWTFGCVDSEAELLPSGDVAAVEAASGEASGLVGCVEAVVEATWDSTSPELLSGRRLLNRRGHESRPLEDIEMWTFPHALAVTEAWPCSRR
jgi:hypothetical protein